MWRIDVGHQALPHAWIEAPWFRQNRARHRTNPCTPATDILPSDHKRGCRTQPTSVSWIVASLAPKYKNTLLVLPHPSTPAPAAVRTHRSTALTRCFGGSRGARSRVPSGYMSCAGEHTSLLSAKPSVCRTVLSDYPRPTGRRRGGGPEGSRPVLQTRGRTQQSRLQRPLLWIPSPRHPARATRTGCSSAKSAGEWATSMGSSPVRDILRQNI